MSSLPAPPRSAGEGDAARVRVLGVSVDAVDMDGALARVAVFLAGDRPRQVITANPLMILAAQRAPALAAAFRAADLVVPDGAGLTVAAALRGRRLSRVPGIDLMDRLCARAAKTGESVFLWGAAPGVAELAAATLQGRHPGLAVAGTRHGYFQPGSSEELAGLDAVRDARPDYLFVALATPFQDAWIHAHLAALCAKVAMGVGGSLDVLAGRLKRAPRWMRAVGLEWFFRLAQEPKRWRRMLGLPCFFLLSALSIPKDLIFSSKQAE